LDRGGLCVGGGDIEGSGDNAGDCDGAGSSDDDDGNTYLDLDSESDARECTLVVVVVVFAQGVTWIEIFVLVNLAGGSDKADDDNEGDRDRDALSVAELVAAEGELVIAVLFS
jgi:hypothetical protein